MMIVKKFLIFIRKINLYLKNVFYIFNKNELNMNLYNSKNNYNIYNKPNNVTKNKS